MERDADMLNATPISYNPDEVKVDTFVAEKALKPHASTGPVALVWLKMVSVHRR